MKKLAVVGFDEKTKVFDFINDLKQLRKTLDFDFESFLYSKGDFNLYDKLLNDVSVKSFDAVVSIGGDGTFLYTSRVFAGTEIPIFGVNLSSFGFNTRIEIGEFKRYLDAFIKGESIYEYRDILDVKIEHTNSIYNVINEGVISHTGISRMIRLKVSLREHPVYDFNGDGVIISTSIGSTAYNLSAGGPILHPSVKAIAVSPICAHTLAIRPYIVPIDEIINISILESSAQPQLTLDGQKTIILNPGEKIIFKKSDKRLKIVKSDKNFSEILKEKLGWNA